MLFKQGGYSQDLFELGLMPKRDDLNWPLAGRQGVGVGSVRLKERVGHVFGAEPCSVLGVSP